jgi:hypothetical protein
MAKPNCEPPDALMTQIAEAISSLRWGTVHITVQDSRVVQIEKVEKIRLKPQADLTAGGVSTPVGTTDRTTGGCSVLRGP